MRLTALLFSFVTILAGTLTGAEPKEESLLGHWTFDEAVDGVVQDMSGQSKDATLRGDASTVKWVPGVRGMAVEMPGDKEVFFTASNTDGHFNAESAFTLEAWVRRSDTGSGKDGIIGNSGVAPGYQYYCGYQLFYEEESQELLFYMKTDTDGSGSLKAEYVPVGEWMHVAATYDAERGTIELYQNGKLAAERPYEGKLVDFAAELLIGKALKFQSFRGAMDEVRVYNRALSSEEVAKHYEMNAPEPHVISEAPMPHFTNLDAKLVSSGVALTFSKTDEFLNSEEGRKKEIPLHVYRSTRMRNNFSAGARSAEKIYEGTLSSANGEDYTFIDEFEPQPAHSYEYWVSPDGENMRCVAAKVRLRHPEIWWSVEKIQSRLMQMAEDYPDLAHVEQVGTTVQGRPLYAVFAGNPDRRVALVGSVHVGESGPEQIIPAVEGILRDSPELLKEVGIAALPCVTLDERHRMLTTGYPGYMRMNANRVDLNRNFTEYHGDDPTDKNQQRDYPDALSEPETQAVAEMLDRANPIAVFSFHSIGSLANADFVRANDKVFAGDDQFLAIAEGVAYTYAKGMYPEKADKYWRINQPKGWMGRLPTYVYQQFKAPGYDLELDKRQEPRDVVYADLLSVEMLQEYQARHQKGIEAVMRAFVNGEFDRKEE